MSIRHLNVCHKLGQEKTQSRVTPLSCREFHSFRETPLTNKQTICTRLVQKSQFCFVGVEN